MKRCGGSVPPIPHLVKKFLVQTVLPRIALFSLAGSPTLVYLQPRNNFAQVRFMYADKKNKREQTIESNQRQQKGIMGYNLGCAATVILGSAIAYLFHDFAP